MKVKDILKNRTKWLPSEDYSKITPVVSVLMPAWNRVENGLLDKAIRSVLNQTFENLELIIVDDYSTDGTFDIIKKYMKLDSRVSCIRHTENIGLPAISEFEAYEKSRGKYIAFMFDDNEWEKDGIENLLTFAEKNSVKAVAGRYKIFTGKVSDSFEDETKWQILGGSHICLSNLLLSNQFGIGSVLLHRDTIEKVGFFDPNVAMSRYWDWDLWFRISKHFEFKMTDFMIGREKGTGLEDSLGNTHKAYNWAVQERMHQPKNKELLKENYYECDIFDVNLASSSFLYRSNLWLSEHYKEKKWFDKNDNSLLSVKEKSEKPWDGKMILYLNGSLTVNASSSINWGRLPYNEKYVVYYAPFEYLDYASWVFADAIVVERAITKEIKEHVLKWAKRIGIKCYYYVDDNFKVLAEDYKETIYESNMKILAENIDEKNVRLFDGVFTSTKLLKEYYLENNLHDNIQIMEPILDEAQLQKYNQIVKPVNILFFGNMIRGEILIETILPALKKISKDIKINLYCPDETYYALESMKHEKISNLAFHRFSRTLDLDTALKRLKNIHIQLHCGPVINNNKYKTANALINSVCLGATLIATNDYPYSLIQSSKPVCLLADNNMESWEKAIRKMCDKKFHEDMYKNALEYCRKTYSETMAVNSIKEMLKEVNSYSLIDLNRRLLAYTSQLNGIIGNFYAGNVGSNITSNQDLSNKGLVSSPLFLSTLKSDKILKSIDSVVKNWSKQGKRGIYSFLPVSISSPVSYGEYAESKLKKNMETVGFIVIAENKTNVMIEFTAGDKIVEQQYLQVEGINKIKVKIPNSEKRMRIRIANNSYNTRLYILERKFLTRTMFDFQEIKE